MPRGVRAVHGIEAPYAVHGTGTSSGGDYAIMPTESWLAVQCWCQAEFVAVPQYELRHMGITRSCGSLKCRGEHEPFGPPHLGYLLPTQVPGELTEWLAKHGVKKPRYPRRLQIRKRETPPTSARLATRRDMVAAAFVLTPSPIAIAKALDLPKHTVMNDIVWLRRMKRL